MYARKLSIYDFKCFEKAVLDLQYPGREGDPISEIPNINLILGENGGGKSSVLRALAIAILAPALAGYVPYRLVRRSDKGHPAKEALLKVEAVANEGERIGGLKGRLELLARVDPASRGSQDRINLKSTPESPIDSLLYDDYSPAFFMVGYGATRRVETGDFSESSARRTRGLRYLRVAGLFEDHVALRPLTSWLGSIPSERLAEAIQLLDSVLPDTIRFRGDYDGDDRQFVFEFEGVSTPFTALSDGYKAFIGWAGDLIGHLADVAPAKTPLVDVSGIVLIDEIDLHLHPAWQRAVVPMLAKGFPKLQFIMTSHSPLIASTVKRENVFVTEHDAEGGATIRQLDEYVFGRSAEQLLLSPYFGLLSTRSESFGVQSDELFSRVAKGDSNAALEYLDSLIGPVVSQAKDQAG